MTIRFFKFQANGNDFILIYNRGNSFQANQETIARLCHRQLGIGAGGLILLGMSGNYDFEMQYFNSDGSSGEMCGNGGRSIAAMAYMQGIAGKRMQFTAGDGLHEAQIKGTDATGRIFDISLKMQKVQEIQLQEEGFFLNTGVPHLVQFVSDIEAVDVAVSGRKLRNDGRFAPGGDFQVHFRKAGNSYEDIWLRGPVEWVFQGTFFV